MPDLPQATPSQASPSQADLTLTAYQLDGHPLPPLRPATVRRGWMDETPDGFAYRCLPLTAANGHGWEVQGQTGFEAWWTGGPAPEDVVLRVLKPGGLAPASHFGHGVLTFPLPVLLRTAPGQVLWVSGPPNAPKDGIAPLTGLVETDWAPMSFTMNWRFTRANHVVRFIPGEPVAFFFPLPRDLLPRTRPEARRLAENPDLAAAHAGWSAGRDHFNAALKQENSPERARGWQRDYHHGQRAAGHPTRPRARPFPPPPED